LAFDFDDSAYVAEESLSVMAVVEASSVGGILESQPGIDWCGSVVGGTYEDLPMLIHCYLESATYLPS
jgi:hypothetical protein